jgi:hypothetical protein
VLGAVVLNMTLHKPPADATRAGDPEGPAAIGRISEATPPCACPGIDAVDRRFSMPPG